MSHRTLRVRSSWFALLIAACACGPSGESAEAPRPSTEARRPPSTPEAPAAAAPRADATEAEARALVDRWVRSQNAGDFDTYAQLYASRFTGVKRTPERTVAFDRPGWMRDRRRMFARPMSVSVSDLVVHPTSSTVDVRFVQRWSSGSYADEGQKRLSLTREAGQLRIATEEMLAATRLGELDAALTVGTFVALPSSLGPLAVLAPAHENEAEGAPTLVASEEPYVIVRDAASSVPPAFAGLVGREVTVIERARVCAGRVAGARLARLVVPHFGMVQRWNGDDAGTRVPPASPAERAAEAWELGSRTYYALAITSDCDQPVAVRLGAPQTVPAYAPRVPTPRERSSLRGAFERTSRFAALERAYAQYVDEGEPDELHPAPPAQRAAWAAADPIVVFTHGDRSVASIVHNSEGCGGFDVSAWAGFELGAGTPRELRAEASIGDYVSVVAVFDADGDGNLEAIIRQGLASWALVRFAPTASPVRSIEVDYLDCPC